ncbi:MAG TPA: 50S ribosomal protein L29 [Gemmatimonadales bacterium]|nr:50S ribosomal protein L29 [Gemmatimonadales bacterium]
MLDATDLRELSTEQLDAKLVELRNERLMLGFRAATESIENPMRFRTLRRDIARVQTILGEKRRGEG